MHVNTDKKSLNIPKGQSESVNHRRQTIQWTKEKDRQYNGQKKKTDNTMVKRKRQTIQWLKEKDRQYNGQKNKQ